MLFKRNVDFCCCYCQACFYISGSITLRRTDKKDNDVIIMFYFVSSHPVFHKCRLNVADVAKDVENHKDAERPSVFCLDA